MTATLIPAVEAEQDSNAETPQQTAEVPISDFLGSPDIDARLLEIAETAISVKLGRKYVVGRGRDEDLITAVISQVWIELTEKASADEAAENMVDSNKLAKTAARVLSRMESAKERSFRAKDERPGRSDESAKLAKWWLMAPADQIALARTMCSGDIVSLEHAQAVLSGHTLPNDAELVKNYMPAKVLVEAPKPPKLTKKLQKERDALIAQKAYNKGITDRLDKLARDAKAATDSQLAQAYDIFGKSSPEAEKLTVLDSVRNVKKPFAGRISRRFSKTGNLGFTFVGPKISGIAGTGPLPHIMECSLRDARSAESEFFRGTAEMALADAMETLAPLALFMHEPDEALKGDGAAVRSKGLVNWTEALETNVQLTPVTVGNFDEITRPLTNEDKDRISFHKSDVGLLVPVFTKTRELGETGKAELMRFIRDIRRQAKTAQAHSVEIELSRLSGRKAPEGTFSPVPDAVLNVDDLPELFMRFDGVTELQNRMDSHKPVEPSWYDYLTTWIENTSKCPHPTVQPFSDNSAQCQRCGTFLHKTDAVDERHLMGPFVDTTPMPTLRAAQATLRRFEKQADSVHQEILEAPTGTDLDELHKKAESLQDKRFKALETVLDIKASLPAKRRKARK